MPSNFYGCFRHETCGIEIFFSKLLNFEQKPCWMDIAQGMLTTFKGHNWWRIMSILLWHWNQSQIVPVEAFRRAKSEKSMSSSVKCEGFDHCFLRLQWRGASWILAKGRTVNKEYYLEVMRRYYEAILLKLIEFWKNQIWLLHHDNAPDHALMLMR